MTPRCFTAWSQGRADAARRRADEDAMLAWRTAQFTRTTKRLNLSDYLMSARKPQTTDAMLAALREFHGRGAPMNIRKIN